MLDVAPHTRSEAEAAKETEANDNFAVTQSITVARGETSKFKERFIRVGFLAAAGVAMASWLGGLAWAATALLSWMLFD